MKNLLILLTSVYPTSPGDMFVHDELPFLAGEFSRILIFPVNATGKAKPRVSAPPGADIFLTNTRDIWPARLRDAVFLLNPAVSRSADVKAEQKTRDLTARQKLYLRFSEGRALQFVRDSWPVISREIASGAYDDAVIYSYWMAIPARAALLLKRKIAQAYPGLKLRCYSRGHGYDIYEEASAAGYLPFRRVFIQEMDALFPVSAYGVSYMKERFLKPWEEARIFVSRLGTEDPLDTSQLTRNQLLERIRDPEGDLKIVSCGRVVPVKRISLLAEALTHLEGSGMNVSWTHYGAGKDLPALQEFARTYLDFMSVDLRGHTDRAQILQDYLNEDYDLFVNVSESEGVPVSVMEAFACAIPAFCTAVGGTAEIVKEGVTGWLWPKEVTPEAIALSLQSFAALSGHERQKMGANARFLWETLCSARNNYHQMALILSGQTPPGPVPSDETSLPARFKQQE